MIDRIVALDPGGTTGWAMVTYEDGKEPQYNCGMFRALEHHKELYDALGMWQTESYRIVCESFEYRNASRPGLVLSSVEYIGVMKLFCQERNVPYHFQSASQGKIRDKPNAFVKPSNLKRLGLWSPSMVHAMDAYGHLLYYTIHNDPARKIEAAALLLKGWKD